MIDTIEYQKSAVQPIVCLQSGWALIKEQYGLILLISFLGLLIGSLVPLGILLGPMMCGIYLAMFARLRGESANFDMLFKGFDFFGPGVIASLVQIVPIFVILLPFNFYFIFKIIRMSEALQYTQDPLQVQQALSGLFIQAIPLFAILMLLFLGMTVLFTFTYPLIVDKKLSGFDAVKLSIKAAMDNLGGVIGLVLLNMCLGMLGTCCCYIGMILVLPISLAANVIAYQQVFLKEVL